jgi:hypothetical protein
LKNKIIKFQVNFSNVLEETDQKQKNSEQIKTKLSSKDESAKVIVISNYKLFN